MGNVMVIPAKRQVGNTARQQDAKPKLRVAAYCRVSTDSDEQATSYDAQVEHYTEFIQKTQNGQVQVNHNHFLGYKLLFILIHFSDFHIHHSVNLEVNL